MADEQAEPLSARRTTQAARVFGDQTASYDERRTILPALVPVFLRFRLSASADGAGERGSASGGRSLGALLRRVFGKALVEAHCPFGRPVCEDDRQDGCMAVPAASRLPAIYRCVLARACPYGVLFAESLTARPPFALFVHGQDPPGKLTVELTLYGPATSLYGWALHALSASLRGGLGPHRLRFSVTGVERLGWDGDCSPLAGADLAALPADLAPDLLAVGIEPFLASAPVIVELLSPARIKTERHLLRRGPVPFEALVARILDRYRDLFGEASELLRPDIRTTVLGEAASVPVLRDETRWVEARDYSARNDRAIPLGGLVGRLVYGARAGRFLPILRAGEILHAGKNVASGCGRFRILLAEVEP